MSSLMKSASQNIYRFVESFRLQRTQDHRVQPIYLIEAKISAALYRTRASGVESISGLGFIVPLTFRIPLKVPG